MFKFSDELNLNGDFKIDKFIQKTVIDVNENGTTASSAALVSMMLYCDSDNKSKRIIVNCNVPFMYTINNNYNNKILFKGIFNGN